MSLDAQVTRIQRDEVSFTLQRTGESAVTFYESSGRKVALVRMPAVDARKLYWELKRVLDIEVAE